MIHPDTELRVAASGIGYGLFVVRRIPRGTVTWVQDAFDRVLAPAEVQALPDVLGSQLERYTWRNADGAFVLCWDLARFVNHGCEPNCLRTAGGFEIAIRDIEVGEEMTNDYAQLGLHEGERFQCRCGSARCRTEIHAQAVPALEPAWKRALASALPDLHRVTQPLWSLLPAGAAQNALADRGD